MNLGECAAIWLQEGERLLGAWSEEANRQERHAEKEYRKNKRSCRSNGCRSEGKGERN